MRAESRAASGLMPAAGLPTLGIIAGSGHLPLQLAQHCRQTGRPYFILTFENALDPAALSGLPHAIVRLGAVGDALAQLRQAGVKELVLAGSIRRPKLAALRPDMAGTKLLARLGTAFFSGDDALLRAIIAYLGEEGFTVVASEAILGGLLADEGVLGSVQPDEQARKDIALGLKAARLLGSLDIGQAVIVENGYVLGVEAAEGTEALIVRCSELKRGHGGVLVKARKPGQDERADRPAIGVRTVEQLHAAGFAGVAIEAQGGIILKREATIARADALGIFIVGAA